MVFLDDDEVVDDADFLQKAMCGLAKLTKRAFHPGQDRLSIPGSYLSKSYGRIRYNRFLAAGKTFQQMDLERPCAALVFPDRTIRAAAVLCVKGVQASVVGSLDRCTAKILDYMLDPCVCTVPDIWFDNQWRLAPPSSRKPRQSRALRSGYLRWLYEYRKMEYHRTQIDLLQVKPSSLEPYPGPVHQARHHEAHSFDRLSQGAWRALDRRHYRRGEGGSPAKRRRMPSGNSEVLRFPVR